MEQYERIKEYCQTVCNKIRFKGAKPAVYDEIESHICDLRDAYMEDGDSEASATDKAIVQMGDPITVGMELDKVHRPSSQWQMLTGVFMLAFASGLIRYLVMGQAFGVFSMLIVGVGSGIMLTAYFYGFDFLHKYTIEIAAKIIICYFGLRIFSGQVMGEDYARLGGFIISFSYGQLLFPVVYGILVYFLGKRGFKGIMCCGVIFVVMLSESLGSGGILYFGISSLALTYIAYKRGAFSVKAHGLYLLMFMLGMILIAAGISIKERYDIDIGAIRRISYTEEKIGEILKGEVFWGKGSGPGIAETLDFSKDVVLNSYMLLALVHEFGWWCLVAVTLIFTGTAIFCTVVCLKIKDLLGQIIGAGVLLALVFQGAAYTMVNFGIVNIFPAKVSMPFVSSGDMAVLLNFLLIGLMLSAFRNKNIVMKDCKHHIELQ